MRGGRSGAQRNQSNKVQKSQKARQAEKDKCRYCYRKGHILKDCRAFEKSRAKYAEKRDGEKEKNREKTKEKSNREQQYRGVVLAS